MSKDTIIVDLNNEAVSYLQEGNYRAAVWDLEVSMDRLMSQEPGNNYDPGALRVASVPIAPSPEAANNNIFEFYRRAFRILSEPSQQERIHPVSNMIVCKFNTAIAYHDDGIRRNRPSHLVRALDMYEEILHTMQNYGIQGHMLLLMAIGNNMGHIHCHLFNFDQTRQALYWVRQLALSCEETACPLSYDDYSFFHKTVFIFNGRDLNIAPAA